MTYSELAELLATSCSRARTLADSGWDIKGLIVYPCGSVFYLDGPQCESRIEEYKYQWQYFETNGKPIKKISFDAWLSYFNVLPTTTYMLRLYGSGTVRVAVDDYQIEESK